MKNSSISIILGIIGGLIFLLIPTIDIIMHPSKYSGNAIMFGYIAGFFVAIIIFAIVSGVSFIILNFFRKGKK